MSIYISSILEIPVTKLINGCSAIVGGIFLSALIVSYLNYDVKTKYEPDMSIDEEVKEAEYKKEARETRQKKTEFGQKWFSELESLEERELTNEELVELRSKSIHEETPEGAIIMFYNSDTESFWYYSDNKNISNRTLDALARMYTVENNCKQVCVNHKKEIENVQKKLCDMIIAKSNSIDMKKDISTDDVDDVFVKPKITKKSLIKRHQRIIVERVNRFSYKGKIAAFKKHQKKLDDSKKSHETMTFTEYKESLRKKTE